MARDSMTETDAVDTSSAEAPWVDLALQLKQDLTSIILMSEDDLQVQCQHLSVFSVNHIPPCISGLFNVYSSVLSLYHLIVLQLVNFINVLVYFCMK